MFYIAAAIYATGCVFYVVVGKGETQDWVRPYLGEDTAATTQKPANGQEQETKIV